jgi:site-specific recombinase XerC
MTNWILASAAALRLNTGVLASAATSHCVACCQHLAKVYDQAHPRAKKKG